MRTGVAFDMNNAAEAIEDILRPFTRSQREVIANIAGWMLNANEDTLKQENAGQAIQGVGEPIAQM